MTKSHIYLRRREDPLRLRKASMQGSFENVGLEAMFRGTEITCGSSTSSSLPPCVDDESIVLLHSPL